MTPNCMRAKTIESIAFLLKTPIVLAWHYKTVTKVIPFTVRCF
jgi:hypothetical protein